MEYRCLSGRIVTGLGSDNPLSRVLEHELMSRSKDQGDQVLTVVILSMSSSIKIKHPVLRSGKYVIH